jgi:hypothetical protein
MGYHTKISPPPRLLFDKVNDDLRAIRDRVFRCYEFCYRMTYPAKAYKHHQHSTPSHRLDVTHKTRRSTRNITTHGHVVDSVQLRWPGRNTETNSHQVHRRPIWTQRKGAWAFTLVRHFLYIGTSYVHLRRSDGSSCQTHDWADNNRKRLRGEAIATPNIEVISVIIVVVQATTEGLQSRGMG